MSESEDPNLVALERHRSRMILGKTFIKALLDAGVVAVEDRVRRVVIDVAVDEAIVIYVERYGDDRLLDIATSLKGVEIREVSS